MDRRRALCHLGVGVVGIVGCAGLPTYTAAIQQKNLRLDGTEIEAALAERGPYGFGRREPLQTSC